MTIETIQELIDKAIALEDVNHISSHKFSPSLFGRCYRAQFWKRKGEPMSNPFDRRTLRVFKAGKLFEQFVKDLLIKDGTGWINGKAQWIECEDVKGEADLWRANEVADVKSQHSKAFWYMAKFKGDDIKEEKYPNWLQVMYYARELNKDFGRLVFVSKDDLCIQEYVQPLESYWLAQIDIEISTLRMLWEQEELPSALPRCFQKKDGSFGECKYCSFRTLCEETEKKKEKNNASE